MPLGAPPEGIRVKDERVIEFRPPSTLASTLEWMSCGEGRVCKVATAGDVTLVTSGGVTVFVQTPSKSMESLRRDSGCGTLFYCAVDGEAALIITAKKEIR